MLGISCRIATRASVLVGGLASSILVSHAALAMPKQVGFAPVHPEKARAPLRAGIHARVRDLAGQQPTLSQARTRCAAW